MPLHRQVSSLQNDYRRFLPQLTEPVIANAGNMSLCLALIHQHHYHWCPRHGSTMSRKERNSGFDGGLIGFSAGCFLPFWAGQPRTNAESHVSWEVNLVVRDCARHSCLTNLGTVSWSVSRTFSCVKARLYLLKPDDWLGRHCCQSGTSKF